MASSGASGVKRPLADEIDIELHRARLDSRQKKTYQHSLDSLPDGSFIHIEGGSYLVWQGSILLWAPEGYIKKLTKPKGLSITVLTPEPVVRCFSKGYRPDVHHSAAAL